jgi:predicted ArsR family transcriptional regulator
MVGLEERLFSGTRGHILLLFRRARRTVEDLAAALGVTDNGVRVHLSTLERDGLIRRSGVRPSGGKPAAVYELTPAAEELFPKAYAPVLTKLLDVLEERQATHETLAALREVGHRLGLDYSAPAGDRQARLQSAAGVLVSLGGLAEVERGADGRLRLRGFGCPLGSVVREHPEVCQLAEALVAEVSGLEVREHCAREPGEPPRCNFELEIV